MRADAPPVTDDAILNGRLKLLQPKRGHRFGHDAVLLAAAVPAQPGQRVLELGAGVGAASLSLLARVPDLHATLIELDPLLCELATENIARNEFAERARACALDAEAAPETFRKAGIEPGGFDHVLMNPPFNDASHQPSPDAMRRMAHEGPAGLLAAWCETARHLLAASGQLTLIWRADGIETVLEALHDGFHAIAVTPIYPAPERLAIRVVVNAVRNAVLPATHGIGGRQRTRAGLTLNDAQGRPSEAAEAILRRGEALRTDDDDGDSA